MTAFWDKPEVLFLRSVIADNAKDFELYADITPDYFQDPSLAKIWETILGSYKPNWNAGIDYAPKAANLLGIGTRASEDFTQLLRLDPYGTAPYWANFIRTGAKNLPKLKAKSLLDKEFLSPSDEAQLQELTKQITRPLEPQLDTSPLEDYLAYIDQLDQPEKVIATNYPSLDNLIEGFRPGNFYIVAGRTGTGKTSVALNLACNLRDAKTIFYNLEMREKEIFRRITTIRTGKPHPAPTPEDKKALGEFAYKQDNLFKVRNAPEGGFSIETLKADIKQKVIRDKYEIVFIDQFDTIQKPQRYINLTEVAGDYSSQLRQLAKDLEISIVLLVQINREGIDEPQLHHLKQTGQLEQDAAVVLLLHKKDLESENAELIVKVAKNRFGRTGKTFMNWKGNLQRIEEKPDYYAPRNPANEIRITAGTAQVF